MCCFFDVVVWRSFLYCSLRRGNFQSSWDGWRGFGDGSFVAFRIRIWYHNLCRTILQGGGKSGGGFGCGWPL